MRLGNKMGDKGVGKGVGEKNPVEATGGLQGQQEAPAGPPETVHVEIPATAAGLEDPKFMAELTRIAISLLTRAASVDPLTAEELTRYTSMRRTLGEFYEGCLKSPRRSDFAQDYVKPILEALEKLLARR